MMYYYNNMSKSNRVSCVFLQATQFKRGGGTACAQLPAAWKAFMKSITDMDQCPHCSNSAAVPTS